MKKFYVFPIALCLLSQGFASTSTAAVSEAQEYLENADGAIAAKASDSSSTPKAKKEKREEEKKKKAEKKQKKEGNTLQPTPGGVQLEN